MKLPMNSQEIINQFEKESGEKITGDILELFNLSIDFINGFYEKSMEKTIKGVKSIKSTIDKQQILQSVNFMFEESGDVFTDENKRLFEVIIDMGITAYKQGEIDGYNKALNTASLNCKLA